MSGPSGLFCRLGCLAWFVLPVPTAHLVLAHKVFAQAVWVVGRVGCDGGVAQVAGDGLVAGHTPVDRDSTIEQRGTARLHLTLAVATTGEEQEESKRQ